ncbi:BREX-1 system adenine-specific DNA-methyltransferase PglX [Neobacillus sp. 114]|uniref:BREX-1 system adenine-specific DNA-methyltransferase PglX n=1 Tax=Neobacillus sp. 114 TaxID=3048535 RepID=UPI0024C4372A|nr:BREX-1 system adenine-specific DNA-methyltransferase PglX [Neobacillus sp. 114]
MNKKALKEFAVYARNELRNQIALRAGTFGITSKGLPQLGSGTDYVEINHKKFPLSFRKGIQKLLKEIEAKGYDNVIEEVAYTWFNRLIAIRFMEVHNYLPSKVRILSSETKGKVDPDILTEYQYTDLPVNKEEIAILLAQGNREAAFRKLLVAQCNELSEIMPFLFEKVEDFTELLLPKSLLYADSLINRLVSDLDETDFQVVEVIGWLYQFYMSEKKEQVGGLKNNAVKKEDLPVVTQLFTPKWIVEYMVQNSLGKLYDEWVPENTISKDWEFYLKSTEKLPIPNVTNLEEIKIIDPACGSGHILVYAFDLLYDMYLAAGYAERDIPALIIEKNLYGLDIDKRAVQMASFAIMMKGQEKYRRFIKKAKEYSLNIVEIQDSDSLSTDTEDYFSKKAGEISWAWELHQQFANAKQFGSLIVPSESASFYREQIFLIQSFEAEDLVEEVYKAEIKEKVLPVLKQAYLLALDYEIVITNPPYHNKYNPVLKSFMTQQYKDFKSDLYSAFIFRCSQMTVKNGFAGLMTPFTWMFIATHEKLRRYIVENQSITSLIQLEYSAFTEATVPICTFVLQNQNQISNGEYIRLEQFKGADQQPIKVKEAIRYPVNYRYTFDNKNISRINGLPIAYWATEEIRVIFETCPSLSEFAEPKQGLATANNDRFLRLWHEVQIQNIGYGYESIQQTIESEKKWFPYNKGGAFRKWYGNQDYVVNWENNGFEIRHFVDENGKVRSRPQNTEYYLREGITWSDVSSSYFGARYTPKGFLFDVKGSSLFVDSKEMLFYIYGILTSKITREILKYLNPTLSFQVGDLKRIPIKESHKKQVVISIVRENIDISKADWDSYENSWSFTKNPFLKQPGTLTKLSDCFAYWEMETRKRFRQLQKNEETLNEFFLKVYGLEDQLTSEVLEEEVTVRNADRDRDAKSFLSYCMGLMMGRYSLDFEGLAYAGGEWDSTKYKQFQPDSDGIIPLTDTEYFEDDVVARLQELLVILFGQDTLAENLRWLAESLTMKANETPVERLRRYFFDEFYADHCKIYQKRPIYWMAESGNKKGFRALFYLHRYIPETLATMRFSYVQNLQEKLSQEQKRLEQDLVNPDLSAATKKRYDKQLATIKSQQEELIDFDKKLAELANQRIALDLDDGVVVNYEKLQNVLAKIK